MSDLPSDMLSAAQERDARFRQIDLGIEVLAGLRDNRPLQILMERLRTDADQAMADFATANPADVGAITALQARVFRFRYTFETLNIIVANGQMAEQSVMSEDQAEGVRQD